MLVTNIVVGACTGLLAIATFIMAWQTRIAAQKTAEMAESSHKIAQASFYPNIALTLQLLPSPRETIENRGPGPARNVSVSIGEDPDAEFDVVCEEMPPGSFVGAPSNVSEARGKTCVWIAWEDFLGNGHDGRWRFDGDMQQWVPDIEL